MAIKSAKQATETLGKKKTLGTAKPQRKSKVIKSIGGGRHTNPFVP